MDGGMRRFVLLFLWFGGLTCAGYAQSDDANRIQNLRNCLDGLGTCDHSLLTPAQAKQIAEQQHDRDLARCLSGFGDCSDSALTASELGPEKSTQAGAKPSAPLR